MDELRSEIRAAFERQQSAHPPVAALRRNVIQSVTAQPRPARNLQWLAVAAAIIIAILVVAGLMSTRVPHRASVPANPKASPVADYGPPPVGVPLLYVHDPNNDSWLIGYDWQGQPRGTVKLDQPQPSVAMAPDGQSFGVGLGAKGGIGVFLDRLGRPLSGSNAVPDFYRGVWADDNRHLCSVSLDQQTFEWILNTQLPGEAVKRVTVIARDPGVGQTGISVVACSFRNERAILVRTTISYPSEIWVVKLSDGTVLSHHTYPANLLANIVASRDTTYISENSALTVPSSAPQGAVVTRIRRVSDWTEVAAPSTAMVMGFSDDDSLLLLVLPRQSGASTVSVEDWRSGSTKWFYAGPDTLGGFVAQPGGQDFALIFKTVGVQDPQADLLIVHANGSTTKFPRRYAPAW